MKAFIDGFETFKGELFRHATAPGFIKPQWLVCFVFFSSAIFLLGQDQSQRAISQRDATNSNIDKTGRAKIGLALSGGGAKGYAHIGVLKKLEEMRVPIDFIAGTSMGAMVGGLYATGISAAELEEIMRSLEWVTLFDDEPARRDRSYRRKEEDQRYIMDFELGHRGFNLIVPQGLSSWRKINFVLRKHTMSVAQITDFSQLPIPYKAVVTDIVRGESVALSSGDLAKSIRASMSIPALLSPQEINGRNYVDGGVMNNLPIDVVREMGADIVIAVDIGTPLRDEDDLVHIMDFSNQAMGILSRKVVEDQLARADLVLSPDIRGLGTLGFSEKEEILELGKIEAEKNRESLTQYALSEEEFTRHVKAKKLPKETELPVRSFHVAGLERVDARIISSRIRLELGKPIDFDILKEDLDRIFGLGDFETVDFDIDVGEDGLELTIIVKEKFWGPNYIHSGLTLELDAEEHTDFSALVNYTKTRMNTLGGEWRTDIIFGNQQLVNSEFYQPLDYAGQFFVAPRFYGSRIVRDVAIERGLAKYEAITNWLQFDFGINLNTWGEIRTAYVRGWTDTLITDESVSVKDEIDTGVWSSYFVIDRLNSRTFPRTGSLATIAAVASRTDLGGDDEYEQLSFDFVWAGSRGKHTFLFWTEGGTSMDSELPTYAQFTLGGYFSFSGYDRGELYGSHYYVVRPTYLYRMGSLPSVMGKGVYFGAWAELGNVWESRDAVSLDDLRYAVTFCVGAETVVGPVYLAIGQAEEGRDNIYISIGRTF